MKKTTLLLTTLLTAFAFVSSAKIWRVGINSTVGADYTTIQSAHDAANSGDTVHVMPFPSGSTPYGDLICTKKLIMIGNGYFLSLNPNTQAYPVTSQLNKIDFAPGSDGSVVTGMTIIGDMTIQDGVNNINVLRNYFNGALLNLDGNAAGSTTIGVKNISIIGNYNTSITNVNSNTSTSISIRNNVLYQVGLSSKFSGVCSNNIIIGGLLSISNFIISNNISTATSAAFKNITSAGNSFFNNICYTNELPVGNGNINGATTGSIFVGTTGTSTDGQWKLKIGSPGIGAGTSGNDCGIFGGSTPYQLSGLPSVPSIYQLSIPSSTANSLNVTISVKTNP